ncbi:MAG: glycosyltransferase [Xanthomonadaceae bacterium]|nr:glycosyltransferase [Xanthomonadaceae bacterium]
MDSALVSIAVPIYNAARFLPAALDSLLAQTHAHWEALLWDDGSGDGSAQIAADYSARDRRFRLLGDGRNHGTAAALAQALAQARGSFVGTLDSDDLLEPDALQAMLGFLHAQPQLGMAYSHYLEIREDGSPLQLGHRCLKPYSPQRLLLDFMTFHFRLLRIEAYRAVGGFDPAAVYAEDYDLCLRLSEQFPIAQLPQVLYRYRLHAGSISQSRRLHQVQASFAAAQRALQRRGLAASHNLSLGLRVRHTLRPKPTDVTP